ncbi:MAG: ABC transporter ATP-binding protein [Alphaproteobacteria bacterium]|nr:ABC transporter ATP-binding protein [Alphaproteobacteria bacterium]
MSLLRVRNLRIELRTRVGVAPVIDDLSFDLAEGEAISLVGESGCGKSMTALGVMGLLPQQIGSIASGSVQFDGEELVGASERRMREIRGNEISMIFQEPMTSLNPVYTVGEQIAEVLRAHQNLSRTAAWNAAGDLLDAVRIPNPRSRLADYPFQMSGGQRQRVMIAIALACKPKILIADEPTTALDVTVQAQIFDLLRDLRRETGTSIILITHDMGAVAEMADRMIVMYAGRTAEIGPVDALISHPRHPYTRGLISCVPHIQVPLTETRDELTEVAGVVPSLSEFGADACLFASRCVHRTSECDSSRPGPVAFGPDHTADCWHAEAL